MKQMLDNDIDKLFKSSFDDYTVEPTRQVWQQIEGDLRQKPKANGKYWLAAASLFFVIGLGFYFSSSDTKTIKLSGNSLEIKENKNILISEKNEYKTPQSSFIKELTLDEVKSENEKHFLALMANSIQDKKTVKKKLNKDVKKTEIANINESDFLNNPLVNSTQEKSNLVSNDIQPETNKVEEDKGIHTNILDNETHVSKEKNRIKNVGDLFNYVIAKVDRREQKMLHFSKTEESDMELTQINLGLFKYKKN